MLSLRPIEPADDAIMADIIRTVMPTFGASGPGFAILDPEVDFMSRAYARPGCAYLVVVDGGGRVLGGGGIAPLDGGPDDTCELRKMYFVEAARGQGMGEAMLRRLLDEARRLGYRRCYLETLTNMTAARRLYERLGFAKLCGPLGATGHHGCDTHYARDI